VPTSTMLLWVPLQIWFPKDKARYTRFFIDLWSCTYRHKRTPYQTGNKVWRWKDRICLCAEWLNMRWHRFSITPTLDFELDGDIQHLDAVNKPITEQQYVLQHLLPRCFIYQNQGTL
jgi:hypothetical protein